MNVRRHRLTQLLAVLFALGLIAGACGDDGSSGDDTAAPSDSETDVDADAEADSEADETEDTEAAADAGDAEATEVAASCDAIDLSVAPDEPVVIKVGHGPASEEQYWYQFTDPEGAGATNYGTWYTVEAAFFTPPDRLDAFQAGSLDAGTLSTPAMTSAVAAGLDIAAVASVVLEAEDEAYFNTTFSALEDSGITGPEDLEGKRIGILAPNTATEFWAKSAVAAAGLDPDRDVEYVAVPFPEQEAALRDGTIDVAQFVNPFYGISRAGGGLVDVFDSITGPGFDHELLVAWFSRSFIEENPEAFCAWRADYLSATAAYLDDRATAAAALIESGVLLAPDVDTYMLSTDSFRRADGKINLANLDALIDEFVNSGFFTEDRVVEASELVIDGFSLTE